ncbi:MAG: ribosome small subunit-dependent GTPase A [Bacteroidia bacterium]
MTGTVTKSVGSTYTVMDASLKIYECRIKGTFRLKGIESTNPIAVGDKVDFDFDEKAGIAIITNIHERYNYIIRKSTNLSKQTQILAANIDNSFLVVTPLYPKTSTGFIDRCIATAEAYHINTILVFNKMDLFENDARRIVDEYLNIYQPLGYRCIEVSALQNKNIDALKTLMKDKVNLFSGHSGVGKTALINALQPLLTLRTGKISDAHDKGKHTTTFAEMFPLVFGGFIIDTPGIRELGTVDFVPQEISHYFVEMLALIHDCKFNNCLHVNEKQCAVKAAVEAGKIHPSRYYNYLSILNNEDIYK